MNRLLEYENVSYDTNMIIYYCFKTKNTQIVEYSEKTHLLTKFLIENEINIKVPKFIVDEFLRIDLSKIIDKMISKNQLTNMPKDTGEYIRFKLEIRVKNKFNKLQEKEWFIIEGYYPSDQSLNNLCSFFDNLDNHPDIDEFKNIKKRDSIIPSFEDLALLLFSKDKTCPIITNDNDLTFFKKELIEKELINQVYNLKELEIYNN